MDMHDLRIFYTVAREGGFTRAAKHLRLQQPSVSRGVRRLESDLGVTLLERHKRSARPTAIGREILSVCSRIFQEERNIQALAERERDVCTGILSFGAANPIASYLVPRVNQKFLKRHPEVWPQTYSATSSMMLERGASGEL